MDKMKDRDHIFSRDDTKAIKCIAIILMLFHHIAGFSKKWPLDFEGFRSVWQGFVDNGYLQTFALNAKICVSIFFFLGGYGLYKRIASGNFRLSSAIITLYKSYWKVFLIFIPIAFIFFSRSGDAYGIYCTKYNINSVSSFITTLISGFIGWSNSLNHEWWFFGTYICAMFLGYIFCILLKGKNNFWVELFVVIMIDIFIRSIFPSITKIEAFSALSEDLFYNRLFALNPFTSTFFAGIVFAKYDGVLTLKRFIKELPLYPLAALSITGIIIWSRCYITTDKLDIIHTALLIPLFSSLLDIFKPIKTVFKFLGDHSTNMWLIHSFYCFYFYEITLAVYSTQSVLANLLILIALSLSSSLLVNGFYKIISIISHAIKSKLHKPLKVEAKVCD